MNILVLSFEFPPAPGGMGEYGYQTAKHLAKLQHNVIAVVAYKNIKERQFKEFEQQQIFTLKWLKDYNGTTLYLLKRIFFFKKLCKDNDINLALVISPNGGIVSLILKKILKIPYLIVGHGSEFLPINIIRDNLIRLYYNKGNFILANSIFTKNIIHNSGIKNKNIVVLYPGADDSLFNYNNYNFSKKKSQNILLTVGSLSIRKGHRNVLKAVNNIKDKIENFEYWIIGQGPEKANILKYIERNNLHKYVKLIGFVPRDELPKYYAKANLFILSSTNLDATQVEGFGIVLIEAGLMKLPVIGIRGSGMEDAIDNGKTGILVDKATPDKIEKAIVSLLSDKSKMEKLGNNGFIRAKNDFTWNAFANRLNELILQYFE